MAADQECAVRVARQREPLVAGRIDRLLGAGAGELAREPLAGLLPSVRPGDPLRSVLVAGELLELPELRNREGGVEHGRDRKPAG